MKATDDTGAPDPGAGPSPVRRDAVADGILRTLGFILSVAVTLLDNQPGGTGASGTASLPAGRRGKLAVFILSVASTAALLVGFLVLKSISERR